MPHRPPPVLSSQFCFWPWYSSSFFPPSSRYLIHLSVLVLISSGPRKARHLVDTITKTGFTPRTRASLLENNLLKETVYTNAAGFLKFTQDPYANVEQYDPALSFRRFFDCPSC